MNKLLLFPLLTFTIAAHAVPNIWRMGYAMGIAEYSIEDADGRSLWISCNDGAGPDYDNNAYLEADSKRYQNSDSEYPLTFFTRW